MRGRSAGFTFIEILLVVIIIGILVATVVPRFAGRSEQARRSAAALSLQNIANALDLYELDTGEYPSTDQGLGALLTKPSGVEGWNGPYVKRGVPEDPWGNPFVYRSPGTNNPDFDLSSNGHDEIEGGGDDITNWAAAKAED